MAKSAAESEAVEAAPAPVSVEAVEAAPVSVEAAPPAPAKRFEAGVSSSSRERLEPASGWAGR